MVYTNLFKNIMKGSDITVYENHFKSVTNENYKEFLYNLYIVESKTKAYIAKLLGTSDGVIMSHTRSYGFKKEYKEDTTTIMHKTPTIIERETGRKFIDVYNELYEQGLSLTEICMKLQIKNVSTVSTYLNKHRLKESKKNNPPDESKLVIKGLSGKRNSTIEKIFREQLGIEYKDYLKQKYIDEQLTIEEISEYIGINSSTLQRKLRAYGFTKDHSQRRQEAMKRGTIDYDKILSKSRKTRSNSKSFSHTQDLLINLIKHNLEQLYFKYENIEIITGYNEYCVLGSLEIDIPIIIFKGDKVYKIAIEYSGDVWHEDRQESDLEKEQTLIKKNWNIIKIDETNTESGKLGILEEKVKIIINQILDIINQ